MGKIVSAYINAYCSQWYRHFGVILISIDFHILCMLECMEQLFISEHINYYFFRSMSWPPMSWQWWSLSIGWLYWCQLKFWKRRHLRPEPKSYLPSYRYVCANVEQFGSTFCFIGNHLIPLVLCYVLHTN